MVSIVHVGGINAPLRQLLLQDEDGIPIDPLFPLDPHGQDDNLVGSGRYIVGRRIGGGQHDAKGTCPR